LDRQCEQRAEALDDRKPKPKARALIALRFADPIELAEDIPALVFGNPRPGIPNLEAQLLAAPAAGDNNASLRGVAYRVGHQVEEDSLQKDKVAPQPGVAWQNSKRQVLLARGLRKRRFDSLQQ